MHVFPSLRWDEIPDLPYDLWRGLRQFAHEYRDRG
jgi:hypothetical protein